MIHSRVPLCRGRLTRHCIQHSRNSSSNIPLIYKIDVIEDENINVHICWFNFDALAQGNAYKPTKEPINYRGPGGDRTHDLQTEATPPAASCPARTLHATEIAPKNAIPMTCPWLHWTTDNPSGMHRCQFQHLCVLILNCALALAIYIFVGLILTYTHAYAPICLHNYSCPHIHICKHICKYAKPYTYMCIFKWSKLCRYVKSTSDGQKRPMLPN